MLIEVSIKTKTMKKTVSSFILVILLSGALAGQGIYIRVGGGYGLPVSKSTIGSWVAQNETNSANIYSSKSISASFGAGENINIAGGYKFNENFIFDLNLQYLIGTSFKTGDVYTYKANGYDWKEESSTISSARGIFINPTVIFSAGFGKRAPYARFGIIAGSPKLLAKETYYDNVDLSVPTVDVDNWEYTKGLSFGYQGAIGMNWKLKENLDFYTEVDYVSLTYYAKEANLVKSVSNGVDNLPNLTESQKKTLFKKTIDPNILPDPLQPKIALLEAKPFSSISLQVGIRFQIWKKIE
jgi:hypothetical protein